MRRIFAGLGLATLSAIVALSVHAEELVIWHDKGDDGLKMIEEMSELFSKDRPDVTVRSVSFPTEQWFSKVIAALNTNTAPDIIFNDDTRIVTIQQRTGKLSDLTPVLESLSQGEKDLFSNGDLAAATFEDEILMIPFQRVINAWGARKSWLDKVGESFPVTWEDNLRVARKFQEEDPDGNGRNDTYGMAWQAGNAAAMVGAGINLLVYGNGESFSVIDEDGNVVIDEPEVMTPTVEYLKLYTDYKLVAPDTVNHTFTDMYQLIEGGRVGLFRVGNWNVKKWDKEALEGDYVVGTYPSFPVGPGANDGGAMVVGSVRGMAVPTNAPHPEAAKDFVAFTVSQGAQQISLENMGGVIRSDLDTSNVTPSLKPFVDPDIKLNTSDSLSGKFPWFLELREAYYKKLIGAVANPPPDWQAWMETTADEMRQEVDRLKGKS